MSRSRKPTPEQVTEVINGLEMILRDAPAVSRKELVLRMQRAGFTEFKYVEPWLRIPRADPDAYGGCVPKVKSGRNKYHEPRYFWFPSEVDDGYYLLDENRAARFSFRDGLMVSSADTVTMVTALMNSFEVAIANTIDPGMKKIYRRRIRVLQFAIDELSEMADDLRAEAHNEEVKTI